MTKKKDSNRTEPWIPPIRATIRYKAYPNEIWKEFFPEGAKRHYMVSNMGRIASYKTNLDTDGYILKVSRENPISGSRIALKIYTVGTKIGRYGKPISAVKNISFPVHNIVAEAFMEKPTEDQVQIIHLDHDKFNNNLNNLRWATKPEAWTHQKKGPFYKEPNVGKKLTPDRVRLIKKKIMEGKTKQGLLAKQFGFAGMEFLNLSVADSSTALPAKIDVVTALHACDTATDDKGCAA